MSALTNLRLGLPPTGEDDLAKVDATDLSSALSVRLDRLARIPPPPPVADLGLIVGGMGVLGNGE